MRLILNVIWLVFGGLWLALGYLLPLVYFTWSMRYGPRASANPWDARGLEWEIPSPPPTENFVGQPVVTARTYEYGSEEGAQVV